MIESMCISLTLTIIVELALARIKKVKNRDDQYSVILVNCLTNPIVVCLTNMSRALDNVFVTNSVLLFLEIAAVCVEGHLFKRWLKTIRMNPYLFSLYLNGCSFSFGLLLSLLL